MRKLLILLVCFIAASHVAVKAETVKIHPIVFCNTDDEKIGVSCQNDQYRFVEQLGIIEAALGCDVDWTKAFTGKECNKPNLERALSELNCGSNDVVVFYYSGHGVHAKADAADGWLPQMCLNYKSYDQDKFVPVTYVQNKLSQKGARLCLILTDCCNDEAEWVTVKSALAQDGKAANTGNIDVEKLKKLFYESRGTVIATSSKRGQVSLGPKEGGCFSMAFWDEIYRIEAGQGEANWDAVMKLTKQRTLQYTGNRQEPAYKVNVSNVGGSGSTATTSESNNTIVIAVGETELANAFKKIVNASYSRTQRLNMVDGIVQSLFSSDAQVIMVGRNLTTRIGMPMSVGKYLEELALSKTVKGINIVRASKNGSGKYNQIVVSEIR